MLSDGRSTSSIPDAKCMHPFFFNLCSIIVLQSAVYQLILRADGSNLPQLALRPGLQTLLVSSCSFPTHLHQFPSFLRKFRLPLSNPAFVHLERFFPVFPVILTTLLCSITAERKSSEILQGFKLGYQPIMITNKGGGNNYRR